MNKQNIIEGSKTIAKYLDWVYIPHNDLQGFPKSGWFKTQKRVLPNETSLPITLTDSAKRKQGWYIVNDMYVQFVCRNHTQLRYYNDFNWLIPAIEKLENEDLSEFHYEWEDDRGKHSNFLDLEFNRWKNESNYMVNLELDPSNFISQHSGEGIIKDTFHATVEAINYINNLRNNE